MEIDLTPVLTEQHQPIDQRVPLDMETFRTEAGSYPILQKEPVHLIISYLQDEQLDIEAETEILFQAPCDRCLEEVEVRIPIHCTKCVDLSDPDAEPKEGFDECGFIDGDVLNLDQMLYNEILLEWPTKILCKEDCKGLCSICGQNLNKGTCNCEETTGDPRMSVIRDLFQNDKEV